MVRWLKIWQATTTKRRAQNKPLVHHPVRGLNLDRHTIQEAHDAPWINDRRLNTSSSLATPEEGPLCQWSCGSGDFVSILANTRLTHKKTTKKVYCAESQLHTWVNEHTHDTTSSIFLILRWLMECLQAYFLWYVPLLYYKYAPDCSGLCILGPWLSGDVQGAMASASP